jgi:hypothetical protein
MVRAPDSEVFDVEATQASRQRKPCGCVAGTETTGLISPTELRRLRDLVRSGLRGLKLDGRSAAFCRQVVVSRIFGSQAMG